MPLLRIMAGPDGVDPQVTRTPALDDPALVTLSGLGVVTVEGASLLPMSRELRDARERALGALIAAGAEVKRVKLKSWRRAVLPYLVTLQAGAGSTTIALLEEAGLARPTWRTLLRRGGPHTLPTRITLATELLPPVGEAQQRRLLAAGRRLAAELEEVVGEGVLLHPAHPRVAPRHGSTVAGMPATEVPLGLTARGLPLGVQVAAGRGRDHVSIAVALELERAFGGWVKPSI